MALQCIPFVWIDEFMHSFVWKYYVRITFEIWNRHYNSCHMCVWFVTIILDFRANDELTLPCNVTLLQAGKPLALERRGFFGGICMNVNVVAAALHACTSGHSLQYANGKVTRELYMILASR